MRERRVGGYRRRSSQEVPKRETDQIDEPEIHSPTHNACAPLLKRTTVKVLIIRAFTDQFHHGVVHVASDVITSSHYYTESAYWKTKYRDFNRQFSLLQSMFVKTLRMSRLRANVNLVAYRYVSILNMVNSP